MCQIILRKDSACGGLLQAIELFGVSTEEFLSLFVRIGSEDLREGGHELGEGAVDPIHWEVGRKHTPTPDSKERERS